MKYGIQLFSVRNAMEKDFYGTLKKIKDFGYDGVEFAGLFENNPKEVYDFCKKTGLEITSTHYTIDSVEANDYQAIKDTKDLGAKYIVICWLAPELRVGSNGYADFLERLKKANEVAKKIGVKILYHNHDFEFEKYENEYALDYMFETAKGILGAELDLGWVRISGVDPLKYLEKYADISNIAHIKDFNGKHDIRNYQDLKICREKTFEGDYKFEFRPIGYGIMNVKRIVNKAKDILDYLIVEQDSPSMGKDELECAKMSIDTLKKM